MIYLTYVADKSYFLKISNKPTKFETVEASRPFELIE